MFNLKELPFGSLLCSILAAKDAFLPEETQEMLENFQVLFYGDETWAGVMWRGPALKA